LLKNLAETSDKASLDSLDKDIRELQKNLNIYAQHKINLLEAMELGECKKDEILDRFNKIKRLCSEDDAKLSDLLNTIDHLTSLANAKVKLNELYDRVLGNLENATPEIKALALDAPVIKVYARGTDDVEIKGVIPLELALPTTARTSA
jgi:hypothetical protein